MADTLDVYLKNSVKFLQSKLQILGLGNVNITDTEAFLSKAKEKAESLKFQIFDADTIAGRKHLEYATLNALNAFKSKNNISRTPTIEIILYASAQKQIGRAFKTVGVKTHTKNLILLALTGQREEAEEFLKVIQKIVGGEINNDLVENFSKRKLNNLKKIFNISNREIETLKTSKTKIETIIFDSIIERMALIATHQ
jgi:tRNA threonylcarbamoyladenosine modification (KEOPS) complex Cgi121 subunit